MALEYTCINELIIRRIRSYDISRVDLSFVSGYVVKFKAGQLTRLHTLMPIRMLLTNTKVGRNTKTLVAGVGERALRHPAAMNAIFKAIDEISEEVVAILLTPPQKEPEKNASAGKKKDEKWSMVSSDECEIREVPRTMEEIRLEELVEMNQGLLQGIGVSHLCIESIVQTTSSYKLQSKLTGAGGGGCVLTLLPQSILNCRVCVEYKVCIHIHLLLSCLILHLLSYSINGLQR
jgi:mevalonate kinase